MDPSDPRHGSHPSQSIPDAAYPDDSPYRPGSSNNNNNNNNTPSLSPPQIIIPQHQGPSTSTSSLPQQAYSPSHAGSPFYSNPSSPNSVPSPWQQQQSTTTPTSLHPHDIPSSPPPPYDPTQPPAAYSPLEPVRSLHLNPTPPGSSHYGSAPTPWPAAPAPTAPNPYQQQQQVPLSPNPYGSSAGSSVNGGVGGAYKLGPVAAARARRRRKLQMCAVALCAMLVFMLALIIGILLGVVKVQWKKNHDDDD
ncbi:hypothetical protein CEP51_012194 [Fusarium floridanum]|uniref:Uncharacterized protein n=1 Tax=Fusarium floridanum TaxID=1325733 RepID=A0A428QYZ4_9HYPO|nr:hypothetical protein CEP51_012194 [Fusarium floridanum]